MPPVSSQVTEQHSERLMRLEDTVSEIRTTTALAAHTLANLATKIDEGFNQVNSRLNEGAQQFEAHEKAIEKLTAAEEAREKTRLARRSLAKKVIYACVGAAGGVLVTKGSETVWVWLTSLFQ